MKNTIRSLFRQFVRDRYAMPDLNTPSGIHAAMERIRKSNRPLNQQLMRGLNRLRQAASFSEAKRHLDAARKRGDEGHTIKSWPCLPWLSGARCEHEELCNEFLGCPASTFSKRSHLDELSRGDISTV